MQTFDVIVVGGGISGLSFARCAGRAGLATVVLERSPTAGGCIQTHRLAGEGDGFWFELGAHTCYNSYGALLEILAERPGLAALLRREKVPFRVLAEGRIESIRKHVKVGRLLLAATRLVTLRKAGRSVRDYYGRLVGQVNYDHLFSKLFAAVPSQPADDLPAAMLFKPRPRRKDVPRSYTLPGGLQSIIDGLAASPGVSLRTSQEARSVRRTDAGFVVETAGARFAAPRLVVAVPPSAAAPLLREVAPLVATALARIRVAHVRTIGLVVRKRDLAVPPMAGLIPIAGRFFSAVTRDVVADEARRGFAFHFPAAVPVEEATREAIAALGIDAAQLLHRVEREVTLPSPVIGHQAIVAALDQALAGTPLFLTGNYFGGLAIEDCVVRSSAEFARLQRQDGGAPPTSP